MRKILFLLCLTLCAGMVCSCGDDDDNGSGNATVKLDGQNVNFSRAYYLFVSDECEIIFTDFDMNKMPYPTQGNMFVIHVPGHGGQEIPTGTFRRGEYDLTLMTKYNWEEEEGGYFEEDENKGGDLIISKDGDTYTLSINDMQLYGAIEGQSSGTTIATSFHYNGPVQKIAADAE